MRGRRRSPLRRTVRWAKASASNALEVLRFGHLSPSAEGAPYEVVFRDPVFRLRRYGTPGAATEPLGPLLLVPPLMVTAEIYDVTPELSAVSTLVERGVDTWIVDFGAPEREEGGMLRTLDDHVRAVDRAIDEVRAITGRDVHLAGYSQGGMFCYQTAALRRSEGVASLITFGSPVDIHKNLPAVRSDAAGVLIRTLEPGLREALTRIEGLPAKLTSTGFKLLTPKKELEQLFDFVRKLHDRKALAKRESRRRFLGGEGFVAWPGPALREFFEQFIVGNKMLSGGFVLDGRTVTLADLRCPILAFVGTRDDIARAPSVRAIRRAAPDADVHTTEIEAGHFGLVVGSRAMRDTWPTVRGWLAHLAGRGPLPRALRDAPVDETLDELDRDPDLDGVELDYEVALRSVLGVAQAAWTRLADVVTDAADTAKGVRTQVPLLRELERLVPNTRTSASAKLAERAAREPGRTFFLWRGRAFTYRDADERVTRVARGLFSVGVRSDERVGVWMQGRPSLLTSVTALGRLRAVAVLVQPGSDEQAVAAELERLRVRRVVADPEHAERARRLGLEVLALGGGASRALGGGVTDLEALDVESLPAAPVMAAAGVDLDGGLARDVAIILLGAGGRSRWITNHRWAFGALAAAAACTLGADDTVYTCLPLHHPTALLVSVGAAITSGARLALGEGFEPAAFFGEARRYGATVAFYAGEMTRQLVNLPARTSDRDHPVRLFAGSGLRADLARELQARFGVGSLEFYASTTETLVLAHAAGDKPACLGKPIPGSVPSLLARWDFAKGEPERGREGAFVATEPGEPGVLLAAVDGTSAALRHDARRLVVGRAGPSHTLERADSLERAWYVLGDVLTRDVDGDCFLVGRVDEVVVREGRPVFPRRIEDALYGLSEVAFAAAFPLEGELVAVVEERSPVEPSRLRAQLERELGVAERPRRVLAVTKLPLTQGFRPDLAALRGFAAGAPVLVTLG